MVCPLWCACQAVRAPGVKWTLFAKMLPPAPGAATASMKTAPVNQSLGPTAVLTEFLVICIALSFTHESVNSRRYQRCSLPRREVCRGGERGLRLETSDPLTQRRHGVFQCLRAEHYAQRRGLYVHSLDDARGHSGRVANGQTVLGIKRLQKAMRRIAIID